MKEQVVKTESIRQEESSWQSTATWSVVGVKEGAIDSNPGNEGSMGERQRRFVFSVHFWHSEGTTPRTQALLQAVLKQAKTTRG